MHVNLDVGQDEILERNHNALLYSTRVALGRRRWEKKMNGFVMGMLKFSVAFFLWALTLALLVGGV